MRIDDEQCAKWDVSFPSPNLRSLVNTTSFVTNEGEVELPQATITPELQPILGLRQDEDP